MNNIKALWDLSKENNELKKCIDFVNEEREKLQNENDLLREELTNLKNEISRVYNTMISLETINKQELEEVEEL